MSKRYWVVGGKFSSLNFHKLIHGTQMVEGPYSTREDAEEKWKSLSEEYRHSCNTRFTITTEKIRTAAAA